MHFLKCERQDRSRSGFFRWLGTGRSFTAVKLFSSLFLACSVASGLYAQSGNSVDCSDPLLANSSECSGQSSQGSGQQLPLNTQGGFNAPAGNYQNNPLALPSGSYSDTDQYSSPGGPYPTTGNQNATPFDRNASPYNRSLQAGAAQQTPLLPEPLTEFQKVVASSTGLILPIYGADLFRRIPSTFAPVDMAPVPQDYVMGPGDELRIRIWGQVNIQANLRVDRAGDVYLPQVGNVHVAGLAFSELEEHLREAVGRVYRNFNLNVDVGQIRAIQIYVTGEARRPGVYTVSSLSTLVDALFSSGGPSINGSLRSIELRRGSEVVTRFDLYDLLIRGDKTKDAKLLPGDVIYIPPVGPQTAVYGSVRIPGIYEIQPQEALAGILAEAGGASTVAAQARISIARIEGHRDRQAMEVTYDDSGLATKLADGDVIRVFSIIPRFEKTVTLRGNTVNPGQFGWHEGMHVSDLIPDRDSLLTRNYWWRRAQLGLPAPEFEPAPGFANQRQPFENQPITLPRPVQQNPNGSNQTGPGQNGAGSYQNQPCSDPNQFCADQSQYGSQQNSSENNQYQNQNQYPYGQNQNTYGQGQNPYADNEAQSAQHRNGSSTLASTQSFAPSQLMPPAQKTVVQLPAPDIDWDYAVIERLDPSTLKTELIPFDLGKLVQQHDASQDLELQPEDIVTIFSAADIKVPVAEQSKFVRLEGEFAHAGVYSVHSGETLRQLVDRAGGLTPNAYLYGSEFTRESSRAIQQARIDEYVQSLSISLQRNSIELAASPSAAQGAGGTAIQGGEYSLLQSLRQIRATGRIVLQLKPENMGANSLPDIALEDGDRLIVPHIPATVNVVGAVYDQNSFLFSPGSHVETYLRRAGGPNKNADRRHEFVILADGEVISRDSIREPFGNEFYDLRINPGDTIVVPEKLPKQSTLYAVSLWSQMFSQLALGAAELSILH